MPDGFDRRPATGDRPPAQRTATPRFDEDDDYDADAYGDPYSDDPYSDEPYDTGTDDYADPDGGDARPGRARRIANWFGIGIQQPPDDDLYIRGDDQLENGPVDGPAIPPLPDAPPPLPAAREPRRTTEPAPGTDLPDPDSAPARRRTRATSPWEDIMLGSGPPPGTPMSDAMPSDTLAPPDLVPRPAPARGERVDDDGSRDSRPSEPHTGVPLPQRRKPKGSSADSAAASSTTAAPKASATHGDTLADWLDPVDPVDPLDPRDDPANSSAASGGSGGSGSSKPGSERNSGLPAFDTDDGDTADTADTADEEAADRTSVLRVPPPTTTTVIPPAAARTAAVPTAKAATAPAASASASAPTDGDSSASAPSAPQSDGRQRDLRREGPEPRRMLRLLPTPVLADGGGMVAEGGTVGRITARAAAVRGDLHSRQGTPRQNSFAVGPDPSGQWTIAVVCDGVDGGYAPELAAQVAIRSTYRAVARMVADGRHEDWDWTATFASVQTDLRTRLSEIGARARALGQPAPATRLAVLVTAAKPLEDDRVDMAVLGDSTILRLAEGGWRAPLGLRETPADAAPPAFPEQGTEHVRVCRTTWKPSDALVVMTGGYAEALGAESGGLAARLAEEWRRPPEMLEFLGHVAEGCRAGDGAVVALWPEP
ncbi:protein phosphatase 2C domain-containing protein [Uniformispora flossi]|uniref:protein phosphatase 2C domain-containing protein n=1 Tax=Uniformispora flossi TaxID=3390723 RepID=UPI003C2C5651